MAAVGYVPAMKEKRKRQRKNRKTLVENLCKAQRKAAAAALEFKISWETEQRRGKKEGRRG